ncbi:MAG: hypothetical protein C4527_25395 [Candidatus Omnitrophota bacterium]|nr:MAG: hypothetical protein C4527_25395 [Candidatus Omnitrophota bacterium]
MWIIVGASPLIGLMIYFVLCPFDWFFDRRPVLRTVFIYLLFIVAVAFFLVRFGERMEKYLPAPFDRFI